MGLPHVKSGEAINLLELNDRLPRDETFALVKTETIEVIRLALPEGKHIPEHHVPGEITVQCLSGKLVFTAGDLRHELSAGDWMYLAGSERHSLTAISDCVILVTILLPRAGASKRNQSKE